MLMSLNVLIAPVSQMKRLSSDMDPMAQATAQAADDTLAVAACPNYYDGDMAKNCLASHHPLLLQLLIPFAYFFASGPVSSPELLRARPLQ